MRPAPPVRFAFRAEVAIGEPIDLGEAEGGRQRMIPITGGSFAGERIRGTVLPSGGDTQLIRADGTTELCARYTLQAEDGTLIAVTNSGFRRGPPEILARIAAGEAVDPAAYYFRTAPRFEVAADSAHAWLGNTVFIGTAERYRDLVIVDFYEVE